MRIKNTKHVNLIATKWLMAVPKMAKQAGSLVMELTHLFISNAGACALWHWALVAPSSWLVTGALWSKCPLAGWVWAHMLDEVQCHWWTWPVECQWSVPLVKVAIAVAPASWPSAWPILLGALVASWFGLGQQRPANIQCFLFCPNLKWVERKNVVG